MKGEGESKNVLILVLGDNRDGDGCAVETAERTWASDAVSGAFPNVRLWFCLGMTDRMRESGRHSRFGIVDEKCRTVLLPVPDTPERGFSKLECALRTLRVDAGWADWIFVCDVGTFVNVRLLDGFLCLLGSGESRVFCASVESRRYGAGPVSWCPFPGPGGFAFPARGYAEVLTDRKFRTDALKADRVGCPPEALPLRRGLVGPAFGTLVDTLVRSSGKDCAERYQDWGGKDFSSSGMDEWRDALTVRLPEKCGECRCSAMEKVWKAVAGSDPEVALERLVGYLNDDSRQSVSVSDDSDDLPKEERMSYKEFREWLASNSDVLPSSEGSRGGGSKPEVVVDGYWLSFEEYYNVPRRELTVDCGRRACDCRESADEKRIAELEKKVAAMTEDASAKKWQVI